MKTCRCTAAVWTSAGLRPTISARWRTFVSCLLRSKTICATIIRIGSSPCPCATSCACTPPAALRENPSWPAIPGPTWRCGPNAWPAWPSPPARATRTLCRFPLAIPCLPGRSACTTGWKKSARPSCPSRAATPSGKSTSCAISALRRWWLRPLTPCTWRKRRKKWA